MNDTFEFDFMPMGLAIKNARNQKGLTREQFAEQLDITPRHLQSIEIEGQYPGFYYSSALLHYWIYRLTSICFLKIKYTKLLFADK